MIEMQQITPAEPNLSPQQRQIYELQLKGLKTKAIAEALDMGYEATKTQIRRIKQKKQKHEKYKQRLENVLDEEELLQLSGRQQQVVYLRRNGFKIKDAAKILGISASTARQYNYRANKEKNNISPIKKYILPEEELQAVISRSEKKNRPVSRDIISMTYNILIEKDEITREELYCVGIAGCGLDADARKIVFKERAKSFTALTESKVLSYIGKEDLKLLSDVVDEYFRNIKDNLYKPKTEKAQEILEYTYKERKDLLDSSDGLLIRKTNDGVPGKAYAMQNAGKVTPKKARGKVVGIKRSAIMIQTDSDSGVKEVNTDEVVICHRSENYIVCHEMLRQGDEVAYGGDKVILEACGEDWPVNIVIN
ncbi:sigma factor-like helix-turn-helix DNA-binding protein [Tepidanaerobacter acetatoxydans]|uniref:sigma factor-like helix-turn-helix DNA-binding protein n=1 Tax=Tepidanaerobacter acetatoxydans TaxID=499229 RepID=UPI001BD4DA2B|nr:sigma factor-like helix-turn-helix DNA-binding protein [Tepidanaerobacter acetatoxydans]